MPKTSKRRTPLAHENPVSVPIAAPNPNDEFLTTDEAAKRLKRSAKVWSFGVLKEEARRTIGKAASYVTCSARSWLGAPASALPAGIPPPETATPKEAC